MPEARRKAEKTWVSYQNMIPNIHKLTGDDKRQIGEGIELP